MYLQEGTRAHFMGFLEREFPSLLPRYERLYAGKYPPRGYRQEVQAMVRMLQQRHGLARRHEDNTPQTKPEEVRQAEQVGFAW
jgi:hypothetical protein